MWESRPSHTVWGQAPERGELGAFPSGGAIRSDFELTTHPSPRQASDIQMRPDVVWAALRGAVECIRFSGPTPK